MERLDKRGLLDKTELLLKKYKTEDMQNYLKQIEILIQKYSKQYIPEGKSANDYHKDYYKANKKEMQEYNREKYREKMKKLGKPVKTDKKLILSKEDYQTNYYENVTKVKRQHKKKEIENILK